MDEYLSFRKFIVPVIINVIFWIGVVVSVIMGLVMMVGGSQMPFGVGGGIVMGLLYIILGPIVVRIYCELIMLGFKIYDTLQEIRDSVRPAAGP